MTQPTQKKRSTRLVRGAGATALGTMLLGAGLSSACLARPLCDTDCRPETTNIYVDAVKQTSVDKIDLLFMIDNSRSMADKQLTLQAAVPDLVNRLVNPVCVSRADNNVKAPFMDGACPAEFDREFDPVTDINIAVITSSLGGHGAQTCSPADGQWNDTQDDKGQLVGSVRPGLASYNGLGFLAWDPDDERGGTTDPGALTTDFGAHVFAAGEVGCGFEASLEAWYRFLIDPAPPASINRGPCSANDTNNQCAVPSPDVDMTLLAQRQQFLRPDSLLAIVMLTDENDCSVRDGGQFWIPLETANNFRMPRGSSQCAANPNDQCCYSCGTNPPSGCQDGCQAGKFYDVGDDNVNMRCFDQKRRFGLDFLNPIWRYVDGLKSETVCNLRGGQLKSDAAFAADGVGCKDDQRVQNPIYPDASLEENKGVAVRRQDLVFFAGIIGVPYEDIETTQQACDTVGDGCVPTQGQPDKLNYLTASQLEATGRWDVILGDPTNYVPPTDPLMVESIAPRSGTNPITMEALQPPTAAEGANSTNGHEYSPDKNGDLQYACIYKFETPKDCNAMGASCDCNLAAMEMTPLCQQGGTYSTDQQFYAKAYPGTRHLQALRGYGNNSIVASICPKEPTNTALDSFGYRPAIAAVVDRLKEALGGRCLPRTLAIEEDTGIPKCKLVESLPKQGACGCDGGKGRVAAGAEIVKSVKAKSKTDGLCGGKGQASCNDFCFCEIEPATGDEQKRCQTDPNAKTDRYCYVDEKTAGGAELLTKCAPTEKRRLIFDPLPGSTVFIACQGEAISDAPANQ